MLRFKTLSRTPPGAQYVEPSTGKVFLWETSFGELLGAIREYRLKTGLPILEGWEVEVEHQVAMTLKVSNVAEWIEDTEKPFVPYLVAYGRAMWAELHARALAYPENPQAPEREAEYKWLLSWVARIPSASCECAYKWKKMGLDFDISSRAGYWESTVRVHDAIRASLGQPRMEGEFRHILQT